ncbi:SpoIIE family protein phosphatase [Streptomyces sp. NPDC002004]
MSEPNAESADLQDPLDITRAAAVVLDGAGRIMGWSPAAEALLGHPPEAVTGRPFASLRVNGPPLDSVAGAGSVCRSGQVVDVRHRDGGVRRLAMSACALSHEGAGEPACILLLAGQGEVRDWDAQLAMLRSLVRHSLVGLNIYDRDLRVVWANATVGQELGGPVRQFQDQDADELYPDGRVISPEFPQTLTAVMRQVLATGEPVIDLHYRARLPSEPESERVWSCSYYRLQDAVGRVLGVCEESVDITDRYRAHQRLVLLSEAGTRLARSLDLRQTARELADIAVPRLADQTDVAVLEPVLNGDEPLPYTDFAERVGLLRVASRSMTHLTPDAAHERRESDSYPAHSPPVRCLATGRSFVYGTEDTAFSAWPAGTPGPAGGFRSVMGVPLRARGTVLGCAMFFRQGAEPFTADDRLLAEELVARAAVCLDNARRYRRERGAALTLQRSLLPKSVPPQTAVDLAYRYLPADSRAGVGGDWFDVVPLSGTRVGLVVGDVVGHGLEAAATMGRLRTTVRALAGLDLAPDELLARLDDLVGHSVERPSERSEEPRAEDDAVRGATCLYAVYDPVSGLFSMASAGHLPPAVVDSATGEISYPALEPGPPIGIGGLPFERTDLHLPEGSVIGLFTDGLVRAASRDVDTGLGRLGTVLCRHALSLEELCDMAIGTLLPGPAVDDAALLLARTRRLGADHVAQWELPTDPAAVSRARKEATAQLGIWGLDHLTFTTELIVSELVTNAMRHATGPIQLRLIRDRTLICEVSDGGHTSPHLRRAATDDEGGRGLFLVAQMTRQWGTRYTSTGKTIWTEQDLGPELLD